jgi:hypothetical protein
LLYAQLALRQRTPRNKLTLLFRRLRPGGIEYDYSSMQWKVAMARMQDANMAATEITEQGELTRPTSREIAEYHLDRCFWMVEAELLYRRQLYGKRHGPEKAKG